MENKLQACHGVLVCVVGSIVLLLSVASCGRGSADLPDVNVDLAIEPQPPQIGPARLTASLKDAAGQPISGAEVELEGNMNHAGMVPEFAQAREIAPGRYQGDLEFTMGGDWFILVRAELPDGRTLERKIDVPGVDTICSDTPTP
jgi:hypothetical protein